jgi:predicted Zn-dependent protease
LFLIAACLGCSGPAAKIYPDDSPIQRLARELNFEARRERAVIARQSAFYREPRIERLIQKVLETLISGEPTRAAMPQVILVRDTALNAYSFPDGTIYVHTGLLARLENEAELALLLSHELVHITRQHALQVAMLPPREADGSFAGRELSDSLSWFRDMAPAQGDAGSMDAVQDLRRRLEEEADRVGLDMLIKAHYDPNEAFEIFEHLKSERGTEESRERAGRMLRMRAAAAPGKVGRPSDPKAFSRSLSPLLMAQAELEIQRGRWDPALRCVQRLFSEDPENARGHYLLGELYRQRAESEDEQRALIHYDRAIASAPSFPEPRRAAGLLYFKQGNARRARAFFQSAIELSPQLRGNAYIRDYLTQCSSTEGEDP